MFRFNPYNFTITIDEQVQPLGIPADYVQIRNASGQNVWVPPGTTTRGNVSRLVAPGGGPGSSTSFSALNRYQQGNIANRVKQNIQQNQQANVQMTPSQRQAMMAAALAKRARQNKGTGANPGTPPVYPPPPLPPPPPPAPPAPPPPVTTSTGISARRQKADTVVGGLASAASSIGGSSNRRPDRFGDPGRLIQGLYDAGKVAYDYFKTPGTPGSAATATSPAVAPTPGRFDPRGGSRLARAAGGAAFGTIAFGPVGGVVGAALGAFTGRTPKPIPEERYYRVYKMISQHDHR